MRWHAIGFAASLSLFAVQALHAQDGLSEQFCGLVCRINPSEAPAACNCRTSAADVPAQTPAPPAPKVFSPEPQPPSDPNDTDCQLACTNPLAAPAHCNCRVIQGGAAGSPGGAGGAPAAAVTPASIVADGVVSVSELLDYMEQLYRSRIAGVQRYQFLERKVVGRSSPQSRSEQEQGQPTKGVDTMMAEMYVLDKVNRGGHEAYKILTPPEKAARRDLTPPPGSKKPRFYEAGKAVQKDPAMLLEALGFKGLAKDMRGQVEQEKSDEDLFAEDVLEELLALKRAADAEAAAASAAQDVARSQELSYLGVGWVREGTLKFTGTDARCKNPLGCTMDEIVRNLPRDNPTNWFQKHRVCLVWSPPSGTFTLAKFTLREGVAADKPMGGQLWLPIPHEVLDFLIRGGARDEAELTISSEEDVDRPIRAVVAFATSTDSDRSGPHKYMIYDRVYGDFRSIGKGTGDGPKLNVPHKMREQLRTAPCEAPLRDRKRVLELWLYPGTLKEGEPWPEDVRDSALKGRSNSDDRCLAALRTAEVLLTDRIREQFYLNRPIPSAAEEAKMIYEQFGCVGQMQNDPNLPCRDQRR